MPQHPTTALFVRLPAEQARKLDRAAHALGSPKKDLVAGLVDRYVDPDSRDGLDARSSTGWASRATPTPPDAQSNRAPTAAAYDADVAPAYRIMGIVNVTPDSFSDGGEWFERDAAIAHGRRLVEEGATIVDVGGESTRPFADPVPEEEELA